MAFDLMSISPVPLPHQSTMSSGDPAIGVTVFGSPLFDAFELMTPHPYPDAALASLCRAASGVSSARRLVDLAHFLQHFIGGLEGVEAGGDAAIHRGVQQHLLDLLDADAV